MWDLNISKQIKDYFGESLNGRTIYAKLKKCTNKDILNYLKITLEKEPLYEKETNIVRLIIQNKDLNTCLVCGKKLTYSYIIQHKHHCSLKCANNDLNVKEKKKISIKQHFGVEYPSQTENFKKAVENRDEEKAKEARKKTCLKRFGCENAFQNKEIREKRYQNTNGKIW